MTPCWRIDRAWRRSVRFRKITDAELDALARAWSAWLDGLDLRAANWN